MDDTSEVLATVSASPGRRWMGALSMYGMAILLFYVAFSQPPAIGWQLFLIAAGGGSLWLADGLRRATSRVIELTYDELRDDTGELIARVADIQGVDRGFFAFKPSNGFLVRTTTPQGPRRWLPGLWWRVGRQIGVGGVTPGSQTKFLTEILAALIAERDGQIEKL